MNYTSRFCLIFILLVHFALVVSVPHEFCSHHFDGGNCGRPAESVFYYYKPGSRCEVRSWRGCPTLNKFPDYFSCLHACVARIWGNPLEIPSSSEEDNADKITENAEAEFEWREELEALEPEEMEVVDEILDEVVEDKEDTAEDSDTTPPLPTFGDDSDYSFTEVEVVVE